MGIINPKKELSTSEIMCNDSFQVELSFTAEPRTSSSPMDIVLLLDRSESMEGTALISLKKGAKKFVDIIDEATSQETDGEIGNNSRIGIVSFASTATKDTLLTNSVSSLKSAINALNANGFTNHAEAFTKAIEMFDPVSAKKKIIVMFTDGRTTIGGNADAIAELAKQKGITIYIIGLSGNGGIDKKALNSWASYPPKMHVAITPNENELEELFEQIANSITKPGATNIVITDQVFSCFEITDINSTSHGKAEITGDQSLVWKINKLGTKYTETASLVFTVKHIGPCTGLVEVNEKTTYRDNEHHCVTFESPLIEINCGDIEHSEPCPLPHDIEIDGCKDTIEFDAQDLALEALGRIIQLDVTLKRVCPNRRVALAAIITEVDDNGIEHKRGIKTMTVPMHTESTCRDVKIKCIKFVLPEDLDVSGEPDRLCNERSFRARFIAHYIDYDFECCNLI